MIGFDDSLDRFVIKPFTVDRFFQVHPFFRITDGLGKIFGHGVSGIATQGDTPRKAIDPFLGKLLLDLPAKPFPFFRCGSG